jgi:CSLREA domain-containing protein
MSFGPLQVCFLAFVLAGNFLHANRALADVTFTVDSTEDEIDEDTADGNCMTNTGHCTLRAAVMSANKASGPLATIILPAGTYVLVRPIPMDPNADTGGSLKLLAPPSGATQITIAGIGGPIIDANQIDRVFDVASGRSADISGVTFRNGLAPNAGWGGGLDNAGTLTLTGCTFINNTAVFGGGINNSGNLSVNGSTVSGNHGSLGAGLHNVADGSVSSNHSTFSGNISSGEGGAFYNDYLGWLFIDYNTISDNTASQTGGGIASYSTLTVGHSSVSGNSAAIGGGLYVDGYDYAILFQNTISGNTAHGLSDPATPGQGGGIYTKSAPLYIVNSTIALNYSFSSGGGIYSLMGSGTDIDIYNSTIAYNDADHDQNASGVGGGFYLQGTGGNGFNLYNTILARNTHGATGTPDDCDGDGVLKEHARNLLGSAIDCPTALISGITDPLSPLLTSLGPLQNNGGPTQTIALLAGSNAIDGTSAYASVCNDFNGPLLIDQRSYPRTGACDVGAFEYDRVFIDGFE